jgi:RNase P protein component
VREALRPRLADLTGANDLLVVARPASARATWAELNQALEVVLKRAGV